MSFNLQLIPGNVPPGTCFPPTFQGEIDLLAQYLSVQGLDNLQTFNYGPVTPLPSLQDRPWVKTDSQYKLIGLFTFSAGQWQAAPAPYPIGTMFMFFGNVSDVQLPYRICDGTNGTPDMRGFFPIGQGTNVTSGTNYPYNSTGGEEKHALTQAENGPHTHGPLSPAEGIWTYKGGNITTSIGTGSGPTSLDATTASSGSGTPHNNIPPYRALYFIIYLP